MENVYEKLKSLYDIDLNDLPKKAQEGLKDVEENHNRCWARDLYEKNKENMNNIAIFYRGTKITYREMFEYAKKYAAIFSKMGIKEGTEVPMMVSNSPEFLYSILGLNLLGAKFNSFGKYDDDYIKEIIDGCDSDILIATDDEYSKISHLVGETHIKNKIIFSLADSLHNGVDPYIEIDKEFYDFENKVPEYKENDSTIIGLNEFLGMVKDDEIKNIEEYNAGNIDTEFSVNYSSASTDPRPKAIVHTNRSFLTIGRFQDPDMSGLPKMNKLVGLALIPPHSNSGIISSISDVLYKGCTVAMEPIYDRKFFLYSLAINKPNYAVAARNMIVYAFKQVLVNPVFKNLNLSQLIMLTSVGEPTSKGEEKFINKVLRKLGCYFPISIGGGDCERGGMFFTPYRALQNLKPGFFLSRTQCELKNYPMVQIKIVDKSGEEVEEGQVGYMLSKTPTGLKKYKGAAEATKLLYTNDNKGGRWFNNSVYAVKRKDTYEIIERVGREIILPDESKLPLFKLGKEVEKDSRNILSYEVVNVDNIPVIHVEFQPFSKVDPSKTLLDVKNRIEAKYGEYIANLIVFRIRSFKEGFPATKSEKRNYHTLVDEGISPECFKINDSNLSDIFEKAKVV